MEGFVKISDTEYKGQTGLAVDTNISHASFLDRLHIVCAAAQAVELNHMEMKVACDLYTNGAFDVEDLKEEENTIHKSNAELIKEIMQLILGEEDRESAMRDPEE